MKTNEPKITIEECMEAFAYYTKQSDCLLILGPYNTAKLKEIAETNNLNYKLSNTNEFLEAIKLTNTKEDSVIRFDIQAYAGREMVISGLVNAGYHVWVEEKKESNSTKYYVCCEKPNN